MHTRLWSNSVEGPHKRKTGNLPLAPAVLRWANRLSHSDLSEVAAVIAPRQGPYARDQRESVPDVDPQFKVICVPEPAVS